MTTAAKLFRVYRRGYAGLMIMLFVDSLLVLLAPWAPAYSDGTRFPLEPGQGGTFILIVVASVLLALGSVAIGLLAMKRQPWTYAAGLGIALASLFFNFAGYEPFNKLPSRPLFVAQAITMLVVLYASYAAAVRIRHLRRLGYSLVTGKPLVNDQPSARATR